MKAFFENNRHKLKEYLEPGEMMILFAGSAPKSTADAHYTFKQNKNFYYFSGLKQEHFILAIMANPSGIASKLFIEKPDFNIEKWSGRKLTKEQATERSGITDIQYLEEFEPWFNKEIYNNKIKALYLDLEKLSYNEPHAKAHTFAKELVERYPFIAVKTAHPICSALRVIKAPYEIEQIREAIRLTQSGLEDVMKTLRPGIYEYVIESTFAHSIRSQGADGNSFPTIAASGSEAVILHYVDNDRMIEEGSLLLLDLGCQYNQYASDITRTYPANGVYSERQKQLYNIVLKAQLAVIDGMKPGVPFEELNTICKSVLTQELKAIGLIQEDSSLSQYYYHGVSHYLGLDVHDLGNRECCLAPGMVFTVEPGLYIAEENIGIRIEDDVLITDTGHEVLSKAILKTTDEIEAFMAHSKA